MTSTEWHPKSKINNSTSTEGNFHNYIKISEIKNIDFNKVQSIQQHHQWKSQEWHQQNDITRVTLTEWHQQSDIKRCTVWPWFCSLQCKMRLHPLHLSPMGANFNDQIWLHPNDSFLHASVLSEIIFCCTSIFRIKITFREKFHN